MNLIKEGLNNNFKDNNLNYFEIEYELKCIMIHNGCEVIPLRQLDQNISVRLGYKHS